MNHYLVKLRALTQENRNPSEPTKPTKPGFVSFVSDRSRGFSETQGLEGRRPYARLLAALQSKCPELIDPERWQQAIRDAESFLATWGDQAHVLGWTGRELFGLHPVPERPVAAYRRLARYDETGMIWLLRGRPVVALSETTAAIQGGTAAVTYRKLNKPAFGPLGDNLDDMGPATSVGGGTA